MVAKCSRQWGKTTFCSFIAFKWAMEPDQAIWWIMPSYPQCRTIWSDKIASLLVTWKEYIHSYTAGRFEIVFKNGSRINFKTAQNYEGLRGGTLTHAILDEAAYFHPTVWDTILSPMFDNRGKKVLMVSTPRGENWFYEKYNYGNPGTETYKIGWRNFHSTFRETGLIDVIARIEAKKATYPLIHWRTQYEALFISGAGAVFANIKQCQTLKGYAAPGNKHYFGVDIGHTTDRTVICIINEKYELVFMKRFEISEQTNSIEMAKLLLQCIQKFPNCKGFIEKNMDRGVIDYIRQFHKGTFAFTTSSATKKPYIDLLISKMDAGILKIPGDNIPAPVLVLITEMENFETSYSEKLRIETFSAPQGEHDDCVIALSLANQIAHNLKAR